MGLRCIDFGVSKTSRCCIGAEHRRGIRATFGVAVLSAFLVTNTGRPKRTNLISVPERGSGRHRSDWFSIHRAGEKHRNTNPIIEQTQIKVDELNSDRTKAEEERGDAKINVGIAQNDADVALRTLDQSQKDVDSALRERDILNRSTIKADEVVKKQIELVQHKEGEITTLRKEIIHWKLEALEYRKKILATEQQREKVGVELSAANAKYYAAQEELKLRAERIEEVQKQIADVRAKLAQQKNLYDAVVADRRGRFHG